MDEVSFPVHADARGELVAVEGSDVGFPVRRVFTVTGAEGGTTRGGHTATCRELVVLVNGRAQVRLQRAGRSSKHDLAAPGSGVHIAPGDHVEYDLAGAHSVVVVLCDKPYEGRR